jgi:TonB family protein
MKVVKNLLVVVISAAMFASIAVAQDAHRPVKEKVSPAYPELAKRMNVSGTVKVEVAVAANGAVKSAKAIGGHPLLIDAAVSAAKKFRYEPGSESTETIAFNFTPNN